MITLKNYKDHKPKRISFEGVNWQDDLELRDEIIYGQRSRACGRMISRGSYPILTMQK